MTDTAFKALVLRQDDDGKTVAAIEQLTNSDLPDEQVLVKVDYSSLNYKDGMAVSGTGKIVLNWPMVPGIDLVGTVVDGGGSDYQAGDKVVLTGWSVGEKYWGALFAVPAGSSGVAGSVAAGGSAPCSRWRSVPPA